MSASRYGDVAVTRDGWVAVLEIQRPPHNYFDAALIAALAGAAEDLGRDESCRALVLAAAGKSFCAGADFHSAGDFGADTGNLYRHAERLFAAPKPIVAAIQGPAVGGGLGLALAADFRVVSPEARFAANFVKLGIHPGFGLTRTLPRLIGHQRAALLFLTGRRINAEDAVAWGLADQLVPAGELRAAALALAAEIAANAPLAVEATRKTLRRGLAEEVRLQTGHELAEQLRLIRTEDHQEGVRAVAERRPGNFRRR
jgi:enoyl-CoA hydratase/carnithine racemase